MSNAAMNRAAADNVVRLHPKNFQELAFARADFRAVFPVDTKPEEVMAPEKWAHVAHLLGRTPGTNDAPKIGAHIYVTTEDLAWEMELTVRAVREQALDVAVYKKAVYHGPKEVKKDDDFEIRWNLGKKGFDIIRESDRTVVGDGKDFPKKEDALSWIDSMRG